MKRRLLIAGIAALCAAPATAQDYTYMNPAAVAGPMVMQGAINAQARRHAQERGGLRAERSGRARSSLSARAQGHCNAVPYYRARLGAYDARVARLSALCRMAGYPG